MRHRWILAVVSMFFSVAAVPAFAQTTVSAGSVQGMPGDTVAVPISMTVGVELQVATMQFNLTVMPDGSAPALTDQVTFASNVGAPSLNVPNGLPTVGVGWFLNFSPTLTGTVDVGTLSVVIPASAQVGDTYTVQVLKPSGTSDGETNLPMTGANGQITVSVPTATATVPPTATATETSTIPPPTETETPLPATLTPTRAPATFTPIPKPTSSILDDDGCQINASAKGGKSVGWLLLIPAAVLFVTRRRRR